jgi:CRISPR-associated protein Csx16
MTTYFVSRHPGALAWAAQQGLRVDQHVSHFDTALVQPGDTVVGTLPVQLAAAVCSQGAQYFNLSLDLPAHWRGRELSADELRQCNARLEVFDVRLQTSPLALQAG